MGKKKEGDSKEMILDLHKMYISYDKFRIKNISMKLEEGDILGLVGRSGSGKSTLIKAVVGLKKIDKGYVKFIKKGKERDLKFDIGYSPQENSLFPYLTLEENLKIFANMFKVSKIHLNERIDEILERLRLLEYKKKRIVEFSGGMKKRADIAVALIHDPNIIVLDEPFNGLDVSLQEFIWEFIRDLSREGKIIILSSHMLADIQKHCNRLLLIEKGYGYSDYHIEEAMEESGVHELVEYLSKLFLLEGDEQ